jgi:hypothetical protein
MIPELHLRTGKGTFNTWTILLPLFFVANELAINLEKCVFAVSTLEFLGHKISVTGIAPAADHAAEIKIIPPQDIKQLQGFISMVLLPPFLAKIALRCCVL